MVNSRVTAAPETRVRSGFPGRHTARRGPRGFTLIEVVIAITILATVLTMAYTILSKILDSEKTISRMSTPEKIGGGILSVIRRDLMSTVFNNLGEEVFQVIDGGEDESAQDEIEFFSTVPPLNPETLGGQFDDFNNPDLGNSNQDVFYSGVTAVRYFLRPTPYATGEQLYTLFRSENIDIGTQDPFVDGGISYEIYDRVRSLNIECFDGFEWWTVWFSQESLEREQLEKEELAALQADRDTIGNARNITERNDREPDQSKNASRTGNRAGTDELDDEFGNDPLDQFYESLLPPVAIPVAVRVSITFLAGDEKGAYVKSGSLTGELEEYTFSTVIPLLTAMRVPLKSEEDYLRQTDELLGEDGEILEDGLGDPSSTGRGRTSPATGAGSNSHR